MSHHGRGVRVELGRAFDVIEVTVPKAAAGRRQCRVYHNDDRRQAAPHNLGEAVVQYQLFKSSEGPNSETSIVAQDT